MYVRSFSELGAGDIALAGGKGANLGELVQAGLPVPPGFVLATSAYQASVAAMGLGPELERALAAVAEDDPRSIEAASTAIRALFETHVVPKEIARDVQVAYDRLGGGAVAVRSSCVELAGTPPGAVAVNIFHTAYHPAICHPYTPLRSGTVAKRTRQERSYTLPGQIMEWAYRS